MYTALYWLFIAFSGSESVVYGFCRLFVNIVPWRIRTYPHVFGLLCGCNSMNGTQFHPCIQDDFNLAWESTMLSIQI
ncbi:hypothetical protein PLICRDRAFT_322245 [Plicaturopsis crispa FD-325 SS-3]|nr:hypothetical protein PLICRDRAFT_322245 [Plicaturopsis crispa FD-325 SS-3]